MISVTHFASPGVPLDAHILSQISRMMYLAKNCIHSFSIVAVHALVYNPVAGALNSLMSD